MLTHEKICVIPIFWGLKREFKLIMVFKLSMLESLDVLLHRGRSKKKTKNWFSRPIIAYKCRSKVLQNAPREHSAILSTFIKLPFIVKTFILSIFEWPF